MAVFGAGTLGRRIALMFSTRGGEVRIYDPNVAHAQAAVDYVAKTLRDVIAKRGSGEPGKATAHDSVADALDGAWLAIESAPERLDIKILLGEIDAAAPADAIFATNSSSYASRLMDENIRDKTRFWNMHFYMPPTSNAVDLMSDGQTSRDVLDSLLAILPEYGVFPFEARKESTGFIFNRVWAAIKREALDVVAEGVARPEDVDGMIKLIWHMPVGPFQLMDSVGLDVVLDIENHYAPENPHLPEDDAASSTSTSTPES